MADIKYEETADITLPSGGKIACHIQSSTPIDRADYLMLKSPAALVEMGNCMVDLANSLRPPDTKEISL